MDIALAVTVIISAIVILFITRDGIKVNRILKISTHWNTATIEEKKEVWVDYQKRVRPMLQRREIIEGHPYFIAETFEELDNFLSRKDNNNDN